MTGSAPSRIEKKVFLRAPRKRVWKALTDPEEFSKWFGVTFAGAFQPGARLDMTTTCPGYEGIKFPITIEQMTPERTFSWRWRPGAVVNETSEPQTLVVFELEDAAGGTLLTVTESGFDRISLMHRSKAFEENTQGWDMQMASLEQHLLQAA